VTFVLRIREGRGHGPASWPGPAACTRPLPVGHSDAQFTFSVCAKAGDADREAWEALWQGSFGQPAGNRTPEADSGDAAEEAV
jgi:hypothetical protein